mmetsp:Transcript_6771/g.15678  ORF Transcript_6771/g.15678 Transcript_6771/m.15678 type:complete len:311 (+) Transcript_6771:16-948(+)
MAKPGKYGDWIATAPQSPRSPAPRLRLFCVAPVGMSGACFHTWVSNLPEEVEIMPLELPGRGFRMGEKLESSSLDKLAAAALNGLGEGLFNEMPFVIFGHSFGAWLAYELTQQILKRGWARPEKLYVSANRAPQLHGTQHDPDCTQPELAGLDEESFWKHFERRYGLNPDLQSDYIRGFVRPILQGDFALLETYKPSSLQPLPVPLCALCAKGDARCRTQQLTAWSDVAGAGFQERWFENVWKNEFWATEHRYIIDNPESLLRFLSQDLPLVGGSVNGYAGVDGPMPPDDIPPSASVGQDAESGRRCHIS